MADDSDKQTGAPAAPEQPARKRAKPPKKDPARPTRAKANRPDFTPTAPELEALLNPGIGKGTAGLGSGTGLKPPPDNSRDRRADFAAAHTARKSTAPGFNETPQSGYVAKSPHVPAALPSEASGGLRGGEADDEDDSVSVRGGMTGASETARALDRLLREGRPEFTDRPWTPHRPPRPEKTEGGHSLVIKAEFDPKGDQPQAIAELVASVKRNERTQVLLGVTGSG